MNRIIVVNNKIELEVDESLDITSFDRFELFDVKKMIVTVKKDTSLEIEYHSSSSKIDLEFVVPNNLHLELFELRHDDSLKAQYRYVIGKNAYLKTTKFYDCKKVKEVDIVELNGEHAMIDYCLKTISTEPQKYDLIVYHNDKNTISNIVNRGVNILDGSIQLDVTGIVPNNVIGCEVDQKNQIVTFNDHKCTIAPKLLIEENDVVANHSALIGRFDEEELFYLQSRGIDRNTATILMTKGFLLDGIQDDRLEKIIEKYWR